MTMFSTFDSRMIDGVPAEIDGPVIVEAELISLIADSMAAHPRSQQTAIGPSEIGNPCTISLIHKLAGNQPPGGQGERWLAQIGTYVHAGLEQAVRTHPLNQYDPPRYLLEQRVMVGSAAGNEIWGSCDLFDTQSGTVVDWKIIGPVRLLRYQSKGPGPQYRIQSHLYGRGLALLGYPVHQVMVAFLPRDGQLGNGLLRGGGKEWVNRGNRVFWSEPYDESVALAALSRLNGLYELLQIVGPQQLLAMYPPCDNYWCAWCSKRRSR